MATCANCGRELQPAWKYCITCGTRTAVPLAGAMPSAVGGDGDDDTRRVNVLAVLAVILGCLLSPFAALFGHIAVWQIKMTGERGLIAAWIAVVLGYIWLVTAAVLVIAFLTTNA
ncbi:MAG: DUF4190 domain-containing protein [Pseudolysinimonas sp.]|uniref:hypothetical protein n=1 Tax=Pseudolysinimonas sp. TaxID=2680009 RepID=UPI003C7345D7